MNTPAQRGDTRPTILLIAGFGDNASMFDNLAATSLATQYRLHPLNLPGFGAPPLATDTTLAALAAFVATEAERTGAEIIVAHSVASIIASLAATLPGCPLTTILSLEGNLTPDDAYFSGTAADYDDPQTFRTAFLDRLARSPGKARYREAVSQADPTALWQLGRDARRFSDTHVPGEVLQDAARVVYFYNPPNCPESTLRWLETAPMEQILLNDASHWPSIDVPDLLSEKMLDVLRTG